MHLTYGYDLKEGDGILIPPMRNAELMKEFVLPGAALIIIFHFVRVPYFLLSFDYLHGYIQSDTPFVGSLVQV